jgi:hypothetical protein
MLTDGKKITVPQLTSIVRAVSGRCAVNLKDKVLGELAGLLASGVACRWAAAAGTVLPGPAAVLELEPEKESDGAEDEDEGGESAED